MDHPSNCNKNEWRLIDRCTWINMLCYSHFCKLVLNWNYVLLQCNSKSDISASTSTKKRSNKFNWYYLIFIFHTICWICLYTKDNVYTSQNYFPPRKTKYVQQIIWCKMCSCAVRIAINSLVVVNQNECIYRMHLLHFLSFISVVNEICCISCCFLRRFFLVLYAQCINVQNYS